MNTFTLKIAACLLMVIDHTALFFPHAIELPMHWIGRLAAPLFTFLCVQPVSTPTASYATSCGCIPPASAWPSWN